MMFSWVREGGIEGERRRKQDGDQVEGYVMIMPGQDHQEMEQGVGGQETCAGDRCRPIPRPPGAGGKRKTGDKESCAYVLNEVWVIGASLGAPGTLSYQAGPANSMIDPLRTVSTAKTAAMDLRMKTS
jgi:hypothetical protein